jgi:hypothetical protein
MSAMSRFGKRFCLLGLLAGAAAATVLETMPLPGIAAAADEVFAGTVLATGTFEGPPPRRLLLTDVTFGELVVLKGDLPAPTVTRRFAGGRLGRRKLAVSGIPEFALGDRVLIFGAPGQNEFCDAVGFEQGCYRAIIEAGTGRTIAADARWRPVYGFSAGLPLLAPPAPGDLPLGFATLLDHVRGLLAEEAR